MKRKSITMTKKYLPCVWLIMLSSFVSGGVSAAAQASVSTSSAIELEPPTAYQPSSSAAKNPFSGEASTTVAPVVVSMVLRENQLLSQGLQSWVVANGYKLYWNSKKDYLIYNTINLSGKTTDDVLQLLGNLFAAENYGLIVKKYEKNHVIVIDEM